MEYQILRENRRSVQIKVNENGQIIVKAPFWVGKKQVDQFVNQNIIWIEKQQTRHKNHPSAPKKFIEGENFWYLGQEYPLKFSASVTGRISFDQLFLVPKMSANNMRGLMIKWYRAQAGDFLPKRVELFAEKMSVKYSSLKISSAITRWGSCSHKNSINLNWKLMQAPPEVIDYVVVHELAHILQHNHSQLFWAEVENILPDYKNNRRWLKDHGNLLRF